jgi:threonine dehydrogenase-like Zn-dependent dehydrogenase
VEEVKKLTGGDGSNIVIDTTGVPALIEAGLEFTASRGKLIFIGVPPNDYSLSVHVITAIKVGHIQCQHVRLPKQNISKNGAANARRSQTGRFIVGSIEGDSVPEKVLLKRGATLSLQPLTRKQFVPKMIKWYHEGKFPIDKFVKFFKVSVDVSMYPHVGIADSVATLRWTTWRTPSMRCTLAKQ